MKIEIIETRDRCTLCTLSESNGAKSYELGNPQELRYNGQLAILLDIFEQLGFLNIPVVKIN